MQTKLGSFLEVSCNVLSGLLTANLTWIYIVAPIYGFTNGKHEILMINLIFTVVSIIRGYFWRRLFNWLEKKGYGKEAEEKSEFKGLLEARYPK
jgi:hypothetical protein